MYGKEIVKVITEGNSTLVVLFSDGKYRRLDLKVFYEDHPEYKLLEDLKILSNFKIMANVIIKWTDELDLVADTVYEYSNPCNYLESPTIALLGYKLKKARIERNISQQKLSRLTGIDQAEISKIENGLINPSIEYIEKITQALKRELLIDIK